jgi:hypothetical protein
MLITLLAAHPTTSAPFSPLSASQEEKERLEKENKALSDELDALEEEGCGVDDDIRKLNDRAIAAEAQIETLRAALEPFADMAGEMFARGWDASNVALALDNPGDHHRLTAGDFFAARAARAGSTPSAEGVE